MAFLFSGLRNWYGSEGGETTEKVYLHVSTSFLKTPKKNPKKTPKKKPKKNPKKPKKNL